MADRPTKPNVPPAPDRTQPSTFSDRADAFVAFISSMVTYMEAAQSYTDQRAADSMAAVIAGDIMSLDLSQFAGKAIGVDSGGTMLEAITIVTLGLASQAEAEAGTENTKAMTALRTKQAIDEFAMGGRWVHIATKTANNSATLEFDDSDLGDSTYKDYLFVFRNVLPETDLSTFQIASSDDGGSTFATITYNSGRKRQTAGYVSFYSGNQPASVGNGTDEPGLSGGLACFNFHEDRGVLARPSATYVDGIGRPTFINGPFMLQRPSVDGILNWIGFRYSRGNIQSGTISLLGSAN